MKVAVLQSSYIPWKGYFDLIHSVDLFIFYDDVQFTKNDWRNRNKIKVPNGTLWLSVPVGQDINRKICEVEIVEHKWQEKHYKTLEQFYRKTKYWKEYEWWLSNNYLYSTWTNLSDLNQALMGYITKAFLKIETEFQDSRDYKLEEKKEDRLLNLLEQVKCTEYYSGPAARSYIVEEDFKKRGISVEYIDITKYPEYPQLYPPFTHQVSILDLLLNTGEEAPKYIWR